MHDTNARAFGGRGDDAMHGAPVDGRVVIGDESPLRSDVFGVGGGPFGEELDEVGVERDVAVVAELANGDP